MSPDNDRAPALGGGSVRHCLMKTLRCKRRRCPRRHRRVVSRQPVLPVDELTHREHVLVAAVLAEIERQGGAASEHWLRLRLVWKGNALLWNAEEDSVARMELVSRAIRQAARLGLIRKAARARSHWARVPGAQYPAPEVNR